MAATYEEKNASLSTTLGANITLSTGYTLTATDADSVTIGGIKAPQRVMEGFALTGTAPQTVANWGNPFFIADRAYKIVTVRERHTTAASGGVVTCMLAKAASATAVGSATNCLSAGIDLTAAADTNQSGALSATAANYALAAGDSLFAVLTGTPTSLVGFRLAVELELV